MKGKLIGICGYKRSGKSEVAKYLIEHHGFMRLSFAQTLKAMLKTMGLSEEQVNGKEKEIASELLGGQTPRWAMQSLGTEWGRKCIDEDLWVRTTLMSIESNQNLVVDDLRFFNEARGLLESGAILWRVKRPGTAPKKSWWRKLFGLRPKVHLSEAFVDLIPVHFTLKNDATLKQLGRDVEGLLSVSYPSSTIEVEKNKQLTQDLLHELKKLSG